MSLLLLNVRHIYSKLLLLRGFKQGEEMLIVQNKRNQAARTSRIYTWENSYGRVEGFRTMDSVTV